MSIINNTENPVLKGLIPQKNIGEQKNSSEKLNQKDFLELMITQVRNQDPFKPMDNGEFIGQMAQFSTVTGVNKLNESFNQLSDAVTSKTPFAAASLIGRTALAPSETGNLGVDGKLKGAVDLKSSTESLAVNIYGSSGQLVRRIDLGAQPAGLVRFEWDGLDNDSVKMPTGQYQIKAEAIDSGVATNAETLVTAKVESVSLEKNRSDMIANLADLGAFNLNSIREISN